MKKYPKRTEIILRYIFGAITLFAVQNIINKYAIAGNDFSSRIQEINTILQSNYYESDNINTGKMEDNAIKAYVDALEDPYTVYLDTDTNSGFQQELKGEQDFEGIGAVVSKKDYYVVIEEVLKGSPAFKAGLRPLDRVISIDTGSTKELTINEAVSKIRGPKGSNVILMIERINTDESKEIIKKTVTRDTISVPSVSNEIIQKNGKKYAHITISMFGEETENLFKQSVEESKKQNVHGIIIDLRGNGGGILPIAVNIASHFIPKDQLVVSSKYKSLPEENFFSEGYGDFEKTPTVVLIDEMSASASEILALALQEQTNAKLIGHKSFGKGTIQTMHEFTNGASIKYTVGKRYSPSGKNINKIGISPDIEVDLDPLAYTQKKLDTQLEKAILTLQNTK